MLLHRYKFTWALVFNRALLTFIVLALSVGAAVVVRVQTVERLEGKYLLGTDAYRFFRQADYIVEHGRLPTHDMMRWLPDGRALATHLNLSSYVIAYLHRSISFFNPSLTLHQTASYYPVLCYAISLFVLFILISRLIDRNVALLSVVLCSISPAIFVRSAAGFVDRDSLILLIALCSFYCYIRSFQTDAWKKKIFWSMLSGVTMMVLGLIWQGVGIFVTIIVLFNLIHLAIGHYRQIDWNTYLCWFTPFAFGSVVFTEIYRTATFYTSPFFVPALIVPFIFLLISTTYLILIRFQKAIVMLTWNNQLPLGLSVIILFAVLGGIGLLLVVQASSGIQSNFIVIVDNFFSPLGRSPLMENVGELRDPSTHFWHRNYSLLFAIFSVGVLLSFHRLASSLNLSPWVMLASFECLLITIFFAKFPYRSPQHFLSIPDYLYILALLQFSAIAVGLHIYNCWKGTVLNTKIEFNHLFLIVWFIVTLFATRGAVRFNFYFSPVAIACASYALVRCLQWLVKWSRQFLKRLSPQKRQVRIAGWLLVIVIFFISVGGLGAMIGDFAKRSYHLGKSIGPLVSREQKRAFQWMSEKLPQDAVVAAWWDYGSEINVLAKRATIVDEDFYIFDRIYQMAKYVFVGRSQNEALQFLKSFGVTHLLMCGADLTKLKAISSLGSDEISDRNFSLISLIETESSPEAEEGENRFFDVIYQSPDNSLYYRDEIYSPQHWSIQGVRVRSTTQEDQHRLEKAAIVVRINGKLFELTPKYIYFGNQEIVTEGDAFPGALAIFPLDNLKDNPFDKRWRCIYIPEKGLESIAVQLYLLGNETQHFEPIYNNAFENPLRRTKIWKVIYPPD